MFRMGNIPRVGQDLQCVYLASVVLPAQFTLGSDIVHCETPGTSIVILNSFQAVNDLLDKRSAIYSDRYNYAFLRLAPTHPYRPRFAVVNRV